jgi:hypothetical protein
MPAEFVDTNIPVYIERSNLLLAHSANGLTRFRTFSSACILDLTPLYVQPTVT